MLRFFEHRIFRIIGYSAFFTILFGVFLVVGFPAEKFKSVAEEQLNRVLDRDVKIAEMGVSLFGNLVLSNLEIGQSGDDDSRNDTGDDAKSGKPKKPLPYLINEASIDLGLLGLLFDNLDVTADMEAFGGDIHLSYDGPFPKKESKPKNRRRGRKTEKDAEEEQAEEDLTPIDIHGDAEGIELRRLPDLSSAISMPVSGEMSFDVSLESESGLFQNASGEFELVVKSIGLSKPGYEADIDGLTIKVPPIKIASIDVKMKIEDGVGTIETFDVKSKHLDVTVQGTIALADPPSRSQADLYITFKLADAYVNQGEAFKLIYSQLENFKPDLKKAKRDDGYYGFRYKGILGKGRFLPQKKPTVAKKARPKKKKRAKKPRRGASKDRKGAVRARSPKKSTPQRGRDLPPPPSSDQSPRGIAPAPVAQKPTPKAGGISPRKEPPAPPVEEEEPEDEEVEIEEEEHDDADGVEEGTEAEEQEAPAEEEPDEG